MLGNVINASKCCAKNHRLFWRRYLHLRQLSIGYAVKPLVNSMQATQWQRAERLDQTVQQGKRQVRGKADEVSLTRAFINGTLLAAAILTWLVFNRMI